MTRKSAIVLLSGGLDSLICLYLAKEKYDIFRALNFDYGQDVFEEENTSAKNIAEFFNIELETIKLPYLENLLDKSHNYEDFSSVWVPNRNGLFLNIAASYADRFNIDYIVFGANKEESAAFPDNSLEFIRRIEDTLQYSTLKKPKVFAPCANLDKVQMINLAIDNNLPLSLIKSCYKPKQNSRKHCGECISCKHLFSAIEKSKKPDIIKEIQ